jgi:hypothetical protein
MILSKEQVQTILKNKPAGTTDVQILSDMTNRGYEFEGVDMNAARQFAKQQGIPVAKKQSMTGLEKAPFQATGEEGLIGGTVKAIGNVPRSAFELGKNVAKAVTSPIETVKAVGGVVKGIGAKAGEIFLEDTDIGQKLLEKANAQRIAQGMPELKKDAQGKLQAEDTPDLQAINQVGKFFADRYGSIDKFKETAIEDPVGVLADVATILTGGGAALTKTGQISKVSSLTKAGAEISKAGQIVEPISAISKTTGAVKRAVSGSKAGQIVSEVIPTVSDIQKSQVVKALDLTQGDLSNISKATGNDVTEFIIRKNAIMETPEQVVDFLNTERASTKTLRNSEIAKVKNVYTPEQIPGVKQGLTTILDGVDGVAGLENVADEIRSLANKSQFTLEDVQRAKDLIDDNSNIYSKIGDVKSSSTARGLDNIRKGIRKFIEDEVSTATQGATDIKKLNNDIATSYAIEDAINTRSTRGQTRNKLSLSDNIVLFGGGATFSPAVGIGLYLGKKIIETPSFRLALVDALNSQPIAKVKRIISEIKNKNITPETQKILNQIADQARKKVQVLESGSQVIDKGKQEK